MSESKRSLEQRLKDDGLVICAGGYLFEVERRGYLSSGEFVPKVSLDHPEALLQVTKDFILSGSDVSMAFTYNGHREKMRIVDEEHLLEPLNREAIKIARQASLDAAAVSGAEPALVCGNISNSNIFDPADPDSKDEVRSMYREMVEWAADEGVDFILGETFYYYEEAKIALEEIHRVNLPAVINFSTFAEGKLRDDVLPEDACKMLYDALNPLVIGFNCFRGPRTMLPLMEDLRKVMPDEAYLSAMPVAYRTTPNYPTFFNLPDVGCCVPLPRKRTFPDALEGQQTNRYEIAEFARKAKDELGFSFLGVCCGGSSIDHRALAEALGRQPYLSKYSPNVSKQFMYGDDPRLKKHITEYGDKA